MKLKRTVSAAVSAVMFVTSSVVAAPVFAADSGEMRSMSTLEIVEDMGIGINLGNTMEAAGDWINENGNASVTDYETAWGSPVITKKMIQGYADEGFGVLRIPVAWSNRMKNDGTYTIDADLMKRVTQIVDWTLETGMYAIVNIHWDSGWMEKLPENEDECMKRYEHMWEQISDNFKDYGDHLMFEAQNEELGWNDIWNQYSGSGDKEKSYGLVNKVNKKFIDTVRASGSNNSYRHLLISGYNTDLNLTCDPLFEIPYDPVNRLAVSVHYYIPSTFAILEEDASWGKASSTWGTNAEKQELEKNLDLVKTTFYDKGIPVIIGEYGCPTKNKDAGSVRDYLTSVCREACERNLCPVLWDTPVDSHYDRSTCQLKDRTLQANFAKIVADNFSAGGGDDPVPSGDGTIYFNDNFESGAQGWTGRGAASVTSSSDKAFEGSKSIYVDGRTSAWNGGAKELGSDFVAGQSYSFSANVLFESGSSEDTFFLKIQYKDASGTTSYDGIAEATTMKGTWVQLSNTNYKIPAGATDIVLYVETEDSTNSFYIDDVTGASAGTVIKGSGGTKRLEYGDLNYDGSIDMFDVVLMRKAVLGTLTDEMALKAADIDGENDIQVNDLVLVYEYVMGKIRTFPDRPEPPKPDNKWDDYVETGTPQYQDFYKSSINNMGNTYRLTKKLEAAESGKGLTLAYIGGSITEGKNYSTPFTNYIKNTFAKGSFKEINAGLSGTSSVVGLVRAESEVCSQNPDIVVIEFSVNDHEGEAYKKSFESMIKKFLELPSEPAVIVLITRSKGGYSSQKQMEASGKAFDVPIISMDNALTKAFNSGFLKADDYFADEYHPHAKGGQLVADCMAYYVRQAMRTENRSDSYTIPNKSAYGSEYWTCYNADPTKDLQNFSAGSFNRGTGYGKLPYGYTSNGGSPMTFKTTGKGLIIVFKANSSNMGSVDVTVNGKTTKVNGIKQYTWGGPDAEVGYYQETSGDLSVTITPNGSFTIWGIGVIK
ncbi:MAG: cellulase family glycosylhydrolase [Ruminococcus sp.]|nr:cellulase family glycosylhydrolase [Ruminococcus sp.]